MATVRLPWHYLRVNVWCKITSECCYVAMAKEYSHVIRCLLDQIIRLDLIIIQRIFRFHYFRECIMFRLQSYHARVQYAHALQYTKGGQRKEYPSQAPLGLKTYGPIFKRVHQQMFHFKGALNALI